MSSAPNDDVAAGVLVVHGIGEQLPGETLVTVADAVTHTADHWLRFRGAADRKMSERVFAPDASYGQVRARVEVAALRDDDTPPHLRIAVDADADAAQRLLCVEGYWADAFHTPRYVELLRWSVLVVPWAVLEHFLRRMTTVRRRRAVARERLRNAPEVTRELEAAAGPWPIVREGVILTLAIHLAPIFVTLLGLAWALSWIPLRATQKIARSVISALSGTIGDSYVLLASPGRRAAIVDRVYAHLQWLRARVPPDRPIWVVAHSQGCAIARLVLERVHAEGGDTARSAPMSLVTLGSGLRKLAALETLGRSTNPVWLAVIFVFTECFVFASGLLLWLQRSEPLYLLSGSMGNLAVLVVLGIVVTRDRGPVPVAQRYGLIKGFVALVTVLVVVATAVTVGLVFDVDRLTMGLAITSAVSAAAAGGGLTISHAMLTWTHGAPERTDVLPGMTWHDFYGSHDPVPNGPIDVDSLRPEFAFHGGSPRTSTSVTNRASLVADHNSYFSNVEHVMLPVTHLLLGGTLVTKDEEAGLGAASARRRAFVVDRRIASWLAFAATAWLMLVQFERVHGWVPPIPDVAELLVDREISSPLVRMAVLAGLPLLAVSLVSLAWRVELTLRSVWVLRRYRMRWSRLTIYAFVVWTAGVAACMSLSPAPERLQPLAVQRAVDHVRTYFGSARRARLRPRADAPGG